MRIMENKNGAKLTLISTAILFGLGFLLYTFYDYKSSAIFTMIVSALCAIFCVKKIFQESFLVIEDDGFSIKKGDKAGSKILRVEYKKNIINFAKMFYFQASKDIPR